MLTVEDLHVYYGAIHAIKGISFDIKEGEIVSLIGANGAGKTTTLQAISGLIKPTSGKIKFMDEDFTSTEPYKIIYSGMAHVPEGRRVFSQLSIKENLELGAYSLDDKSKIKSNFENVYNMFPRLLERESQLAGTLSGGEQQMLAIGRALMSNPKMLLMDEPSMGLAPILVKEIFNIIKRCNEEGMTILLVEQNASVALSLAHRAYVLETGRVVMSGKAEDLLGNEEVKKAYLGG